VKEAVVYASEAEFRVWFDQNFRKLGIKEIVLNQEVCPDYVVIMDDGSVAKIEAELFAVNFRYHGHDPKKVDYIVACYSKSEEVDGVRVIAVNKLWCFDPTPEAPIPPDAPLSEAEAKLLSAIDFSGGTSISALSNGALAGDQELWIRISPDTIWKFPRGSIEDSILNVISPKAKEWLKKHHHILVGAGISAEACQLIGSLVRRGLIRYNPIAWISAAYDGAILTHPAWVPTELQTTPLAHQFHHDEIMKHLFPSAAKTS